LKEDDLTAESISHGLTTRFIGRRTLYHRRLPTTMDAARDDARGGSAEGTVVVAGEQTAARGRLKRTWFSPRGNIAFSVVLYPTRQQLPGLIMVSSLAVVAGIEATTGLRADIKWPNDVLIAGRKVGGILIESSLQADRVDYAIVGVGINVNLDPAHFPEITPTATSLSREAGHEVSRSALLRAVLTEMERLYVAPPETVFDLWKDRLAMLGTPVRVTSGDDEADGTAESVEPDGSLMLRLPDGRLTRITVGDVTLR
jgi:BirA family biotin operon repressor/biotin-[acetyl-CoA-carboxylase] ligase